MQRCEIDWIPEADVVMARSRAAAAADALLSADPDLRQYWCTANWKPGVAVARHEDAAGSQSYVVQSGDSTVIKVLVARSSLGPDALARFQKSPDVEMSPLALEVLNEPELRYQELSFLAWTTGGAPWQGLEFRVDGISSLEMGRSMLELQCVGPKIFYIYAMTYHEVTLDPPALKELFKLTPMDEALARKFAPDVKFAKAKEELAKIGYPVA